MALALSRKRGQAIKIGENIVVTIGETRGSHTVILIDAPKEIPVARIEGNTDGDGSSSNQRTGRRRKKVLHGLPAAARGNSAVAGTDVRESGGGGAPAADAAGNRGCGAAADRQSD